MIPFDSRILVAGAYLILALLLLRAATALWSMPPIIRAVKFEPFLTPRGMAAAMRYLPLLLWTFGACFLACGIVRTAGWIVYPLPTHRPPEYMTALRVTEMIAAFAALGTSVNFAVRLWLIRR